MVPDPTHCSSRASVPLQLYRRAAMGRLVLPKNMPVRAAAPPGKPSWLQATRAARPAAPVMSPSPGQLWKAPRRHTEPKLPFWPVSASRRPSCAVGPPSSFSPLKRGAAPARHAGGPAPAVSRINISVCPAGRGGWRAVRPPRWRACGSGARPAHRRTPRPLRRTRGHGPRTRFACTTQLCAQTLRGGGSERSGLSARAGGGRSVLGAALPNGPPAGARRLTYPGWAPHPLGCPPELKEQRCTEGSSPRQTRLPASSVRLSGGTASKYCWRPPAKPSWRHTTRGSASVSTPIS